MSENRKVYLDNACTGMYSTEVLDCAGEFVSLLKNDSLTASQKTVMFQGYLNRAREKVAQFINCSADEVALVESTTQGLGTIGEIVDLKPEDNVLICDLEYQASYLCLTRRQKKVGFEIRCVPSENGEITAEIYRKYIDSHTKLIILASVQEINGYRSDVRAIADMAHEYGCLLAVDGTQEAGAMKVDVRANDADFYCAGAKKWIGSPFGMGFLYIRKSLINELEPSYDSYFNALLPEGYTDYPSYLENPNRSPFDNCGFVSTAKKFEIGGYRNYLGALGLTRAIEVLQNYGLHEVEERILFLNKRLTDGLHALGLETVSPKVRSRMSSTVSFNLGLKNGASIEEKKLVEYLLSKNIFVSLRCCTMTGGIRVSMHYYTKDEDIDALLEAVKNYFAKN